MEHEERKNTLLLAIIPAWISHHARSRDKFFLFLLATKQLFHFCQISSNVHEVNKNIFRRHQFFRIQMLISIFGNEDICFLQRLRQRPPTHFI